MSPVLLVRPCITLLFLAVIGIESPVLGATPIAHWSFDGCTTTDVTGQGKDLIANNSPTCVPGRWGDAWLLDGATSYLDRGFDPAFTPGSRPWTITAWAKTDVSAPNLDIISWYRCGADPACETEDSAMYALALLGGYPTWLFRDDNGTGVDLADSTQTVNDGAWHLLAGTMNPTSGWVRIYVDGSLRKETQLPLGALSDGGISVPLEIGRWYRTGWGAPDFYFPGAIDEVRIYDAEVSAGEISLLFTENDETAVRRSSWGRIKSIYRAGD